MLDAIRRAWRSLANAPGAAFPLAVAALAIGIGANGAVFALLLSLLRPLPFPEPDRLVSVGGLVDPQVEANAWYGRAPALQALAAYRTGIAMVEDAFGKRELTVAEVPSDFFEILQVSPGVGRGLAKADEAIVSSRFARSRAAEPAAVPGRLLLVDSRAFSIVGVLPSGAGYPLDVDIWVENQGPTAPSVLAAARTPGAIARVRKPYSVAALQAQLTSLVHQAEASRSLPLSGVAVSTLAERVAGGARRLYVAMGLATLAILAMSCLDVAHLLVARGIDRQADDALRVALGSRWWGTSSRGLAESLVVCGAGAVGGLVLGAALLPLFLPFAPADIALDPGALGVRLSAIAGVLALVASCASAVAPGMVARRSDPIVLMKGASVGPGQRSPWALRVGAALLVTQLSIGFAMLIVAGSALRTLAGALLAPVGMETRSVRLTEVRRREIGEPARTDAADERMRVELGELLERIRRHPGITAAAASSSLPFVDQAAGLDWFEVPGRAPDGIESMAALAVVTPGYFRCVGTPVLAGREFGWEDRATGAQVAVVDRDSARRLFGESDALGRTLVIGRQPRRIVGIVGRVWRPQLGGLPYAQVYLPSDQSRARNRMTLVVRGTGADASLLGEIDQGPFAAAAPLRGLSDVVSDVQGLPRRRAGLVVAAALVALALAGLGTLGVMSHFVAARARDLALRMALGATPGNALLYLLRRTAVLLSLAATIGWLGAQAVTQAASSQILDFHSLDSWATAGGLVMIVIVAFAATATTARAVLARELAVTLRQSV